MVTKAERLRSEGQDLKRAGELFAEAAALLEKALGLAVDLAQGSGAAGRRLAPSRGQVEALEAAAGECRSAEGECARPRGQPGERKARFFI